MFTCDVLNHETSNRRSTFNTSHPPKRTTSLSQKPTNLSLQDNVRITDLALLSPPTGSRKMPSLTSIANSAASGWRKLKDETLNYTPPSTEGPKPLRSPDRKLRKLSVIQFTDLPRPTLKSKLSREIQIGLPQTYIRQCETDRFFRESTLLLYSKTKCRP